MQPKVGECSGRAHLPHPPRRAAQRGDAAAARSRLAFAIAHLDRFLKGYGHLLYEGGGMKLFDIRQTAADPR